MWISRNYKAHQWEALKLMTEADWETGVDIFEDRMESRYLVHAPRILDHNTSGFAALTLDCAVIETMEQFRRGTTTAQAGLWGEVFRLVSPRDLIFRVRKRKTGQCFLHEHPVRTASSG
jgi:hypothetical protein